MKKTFALKNNKKKINNSKGFTLTELLATLAVLSLICTIVAYTAINLIGKTKEKSYQVTINNIEKVGNSYVVENDTLIDWIDGITNDYEYQCVTVQNLIDKGFFKVDVLESYVSENNVVKNTDYIYLERDKNTKAITKNILLVNDKLDLYSGLCLDTEQYGNITFSLNPVGWSPKKELTIKYKLTNNTDSISNYEYCYNVNDSDDGSYCEYFNKTIMTAKDTFANDTTIYAKIKDKDGNILANATKKIDKIDVEGPRVVQISDTIINGTKVEIPLRFEDEKSGVNLNSISLSDFVVKIGNNQVHNNLTLEYIENTEFKLIIDNDIWPENGKIGEIKIGLMEGVILDNAGNVNELIEIDPQMGYYLLDLNGEINETYYTNIYHGGRVDVYINDNLVENNTDDYYHIWPQGTKYEIKNVEPLTGFLYDGVIDETELIGYIGDNLDTIESEKPRTKVVLSFRSEYQISYNANGGTGTMPNSSCKYGKSCTLSNNAFTRTGYKFTGWNTQADGSGTSYQNKHQFNEYDVNQNITLYAKWEPTTLTIKYKYKDSTTTAGNNIQTTDASGNTWSFQNWYIYKNGEEVITTIKYNETKTLFNEIDNINKVATGYSEQKVVPEEEWKCIEGCKDSNLTYKFNQEYSASDFCDISNTDCEITLTANWYLNSLDINGILDGKVIYDIHGYGTFDVYRNGTIISTGTYDYYNEANWSYGYTYTLKNYQLSSTNSSRKCYTETNGNKQFSLYNTKTKETNHINVSSLTNTILTGTIDENHTSLYFICNTTDPYPTEKEVRVYYNADHMGGTVSKQDNYYRIASRTNEGWIYRYGGSTFVSAYPQNEQIDILDYDTNFGIIKKTLNNNTVCNVKSGAEWCVNLDDQICFNQANKYSYNDIEDYLIEKNKYYELNLYLNWEC